MSADSTAGLTLLCIGDVHLGTRPASLPEDLQAKELDPRSLSPEAALGLAVDAAIARQVDAVLFAGDVVESTNARFEALRPLEAAVSRLTAAGISVLGVVGNHDVEALPRLAAHIEGLELLGEGGHWQSKILYKGGRPVAQIHGWSFPQKQVYSSPVAALLQDREWSRHAGIPSIGLLHGDLDAAGGPYAPFRHQELELAGLDAWLLGHIHKPSLQAKEQASGTGMAPLCGYLGSLVGLDPSETGLHGPWLIQVRDDGTLQAEQLMTAPLRWDWLELQVSEDERAQDVGDRLINEIARYARDLQAQGAQLKALGLRVHLTGRTRHRKDLCACIDSGQWLESRDVGNTLVFVNKVSESLELAHDLADLADNVGPPALLARDLLLLKAGGEGRQELLDAARDHLKTLATDARWRALDGVRGAEDPVSDAALIALLTQSGTAALSELLAQGEDETAMPGDGP